MSRDVDRVVSRSDFDEMDRDEASPSWLGIREDFSILQDEVADRVEEQPTGRVSRDTTRSGTTSPVRESPVKSPSPSPRSSSVASRLASPSTRSPSAQSRRERIARSRGSSAVSSAASEQWQEAIRAADDGDDRKSSSSSRGKFVTSRQSDREEEEIRDEGDVGTRTSSAKSAQEGTETKATLGSEADLAQVSETVVRSQSVVEGVYEDVLAEEETADQEWPGVMEDAGLDELDEMNESDDKDSITGGKGRYTSSDLDPS